MSTPQRAKRGSVVAAFPATGKSFVAGRDHRFADSDSSAFSWQSPGVRHDDWPSNYMKHIEGLIEDGTHVLCSSHQEVRDALVAAEIPFTLVYPSVDQRDDYIARLNGRGSAPKLVTLIAGHWDEWVASCIRQGGCDHIVLPHGYYLSNVIWRAVR